MSGVVEVNKHCRSPWRIIYQVEAYFQRLQINCLQDERADQRIYLYFIFSNIGFHFCKIRR